MNKEQIKKIIQDILDKLGIPFDSIDEQERENSMIFMVRTNDARYLIGGRGASLSALNHIVRRVVDSGIKNTEKRPRFTIDVNDYQEQRNSEVKNKALILASRVKSFRTSTEMEPMSSYERMLVHSVLSDDCDIETESVGFGKDRRVVIKFNSQGQN